MGNINNRIEAHYDLFRSDMGRMQQYIVPPHFYPINRNNPDTITIFFRTGNGDSKYSAYRMRTYATLGQISEESLLQFLDTNPEGKFEGKGNYGIKVEFGRSFLGSNINLLSTLYSTSDDPSVNTIPLVLKPYSIRATRREHFSLLEETDESRRLTLDTERHNFVVTSGNNTLSKIKKVGDLGPRIEIKSLSEEEVRAVALELGLDAVGFHFPNRSLELIMEYLLREAIPEETRKGLLESEFKFNYLNNVNGNRLDFELMDRILAQPIMKFIQRNPNLSLILPYPHSVARVRRYHLCDSGDDNAEYTVVETMSGRLSPKIKADPQTDGLTLMRRTHASSTINTTGDLMSVEKYLNRLGWKRINWFEKQQIKIPFSVQNGYSYLVSVDNCNDSQGNSLVQVEIEFIGSTGKIPNTQNEVNNELNYLAKLLLGSELGNHLIPTTLSKYSYFSQFTL